MELTVGVYWYRGSYNKKYNTKSLFCLEGDVLYYSHYIMMLHAIVLVYSFGVLSVASALA
jgi:hypothetical protein